jgi:hypothetical protein
MTQRLINKQSEFIPHNSFIPNLPYPCNMLCPLHVLCTENYTYFYFSLFLRNLIILAVIAVIKYRVMKMDK